ncbi:helix-turn-helix domain-containing protein [Streptomyces phaeochromogenes]|uniref:helix-turn-helix domain-containing protein n=1 Tax=Streptomyces phaeochromogenes TaxID=1923 RepID=UPI00386321BC|nr:helix-turn-helix domain-containing protein [Streptomyces phaeochromogenes]
MARAEGSADRSALLDEDGSVRVPARLASPLFAILWRHYRAEKRASGGELSPDAHALLMALHRAATGTPSFAPETPADAPATVMLGMGEVAALIGCTPQWARRLAARGDLPDAQRVGLVWLIPSTSLDAFRDERQEDPRGESGHSPTR